MVGALERPKSPRHADYVLRRLEADVFPALPARSPLRLPDTRGGEVVCAALAHGASAVVLAHNHPSGNTSPSPADEALTQTLKQALALVDVRVLDHARNESLSMAERGLV